MDGYRNIYAEQQAAANGAAAAPGAGDSGGVSGGAYYFGPPKKPKSGRRKALTVFGIVLGVVLLLAILMGVFGGTGDDAEYYSGAEDVSGSHIGVLYIEGTIGAVSDGTYNHEYVLDAINGMMENSDNEGIMLYINTPGGGVYESDEVYLKLMEYKETTGRPVYAYLGSQATSGGYYIAAASDRIVANRNCWTGSIGVVVGTLYDISGLLEKYGVKAENLTSGDNKAMGGMTEPLTAEQRTILQSLVDEAYDQFVGIIAEGRGLSVDYVKSISDGRIYSALQAKQLQLVDEVFNTYDDALADMQCVYSLEDCEVYDFRYVADYGWFETFIMGMDKLSDAAAEEGDIAALAELMEGQNSLELQYMCEVQK